MKKRKELNALLARNLKFKKPFLVKSKGYVNIKNMDTLDLENNNLSSASSLEDVDLGENIKKGSGFFAKMCSICLVFLLFLSLILSCTIILMHMETKLEIRNLAQRFKQVEYHNLAVNKENIYLKSNIHLKNDSFQYKFANYQNITFQNFETKLHSSDGSSLLQKSLTLMGSDLGRLKAEISGMKSILTSFKGKFLSANEVIPKNNELVPLLMSHVWNPSINGTTMSSQDPF